MSDRLVVPRWVYAMYPEANRDDYLVPVDVWPKPWPLLDLFEDTCLADRPRVRAYNAAWERTALESTAAGDYVRSVGVATLTADELANPPVERVVRFDTGIPWMRMFAISAPGWVYCTGRELADAVTADVAMATAP